MSDSEPTAEPLDLGEFVPLHCHSEYSSLDGGAKVNDIPARLKELGYKAMALTDHGVMQGLPHFQEALLREGIKPILGIEAYLTEDRHDRSRGTPTWHITLLAENQTGYTNLCKLSTWAFLEGRIITFNRARARADWELMQRYSEGVICLSGCMAGPVMGAIMIDGDLQKAKAQLQRLVDIFGAENVYGEIQNAGVAEQVPESSELAKKLGKTLITQTDGNRELVEICEQMGLKVVATGDSHYLREEDAEPHDVMLCIGTGQKKKGERRFSLLPKHYHMRSLEEMREAVADWPESIANTVEIAERCTAEIEWEKNLLPRFELPADFDNSKDYLRHLCLQGLEERYPEDNPHREEAFKRLDFELSTIDKMGYNDYFLITWDLFNEAERRNIPSGPGRGSAAGSIVAYTLDITKLCPLEYDLLFERFLNPDRISMPDIDMDFATAYNGGRDALMEYSFDKYNRQSDSTTAVAQQVTFSRFKAKGALRDSARALAEPTEEGAKAAMKIGDKLAGFIPGDPKATISSVLADPVEGKRLKLAQEGGGFEAEVVNQAAWLEDMIRAYSTHAAAVLIADHDLTNDLPLQQMKKDKPIEIQYEMGYAEKIGLLKMDFLVIRNLDVIWDACEKIKHTRGIEIHPYKDIPLDDQNTYAMFARGESVGTFQFECLAGDTIINGGPRTTIKELFERNELPRQLRSVDLSKGRSVKNSVLGIKESGVKQLYRLVSTSGYTLRASADHKIFTSEGWKKLGELSAGDSIAVNVKDASRIGACPRCLSQTKSRSGACTSCRNRERESGQVMSRCRDRESWIASLPRGDSHPHFGSPPPPATFEVEGLDYPVRSAWEGLFALKLRELGIKCEYEPKSFKLTDGSSYTPDFYVPSRNLWVEVKGKGGLCGKGKHKMEQFKKDYPEHRIISLGAGRIERLTEEDMGLPVMAGAAPAALPAHFAFEQIIAVEKDEIEMTYDIAMAAPHNNYIANGILVHNSGGMSSALREVRPTEFNDLIALVALYRPGAMAHIPNYAARKHGKEPVEYLDPRLAELQSDTYGITIYQEQSMLISRALAGFKPSEADDLRKAIGKKLRDKMAALKPQFIKGCKENGVSVEVADALWADNEAAADYSFNKSHAACYAYLAYITGYLKINYPEEYMAALISSVMGKKDKPAEYLREAKRMGLRVLPPDVNRSLSDFAVMERPEDERDEAGPAKQFDILFGLTALRGVGGGVVSEIITERDSRGPFSSVYDLIRRLPKLTKTVVHALIKGGALDSTGDTRKGMFDQSEAAIERIRKEIKDKEKELLKAARAAATELTGEKLSPLERKGLDGGVKELAPPKDPDTVSDEELAEAVREALRKGQMSEERSQIKKTLAENPAAVEVAGIAAEEGADASDIRKVVEAKATENVDGAERSEEREALTSSLTDLARKAVLKVARDRSEEEGLEAALAEESDPVILREEWPEKDKLNTERQMLGIYVSGHPLDEIKAQWAWSVDRGLGQLTDNDITPRDVRAAQLPNVGGVLVGLEAREIRSGKMYKAVLEDLTGAREITIWPDTADGKEDILQVGEILSFKIQIQEDTFAAQKQAEAEEEAEEADEESGKPIQLVAASFSRWDPQKSVRPRPRAELQEYLGMSATDTPPEELAEAIANAEAAQKEMLQKASTGEAAKSPSPDERRVVPKPPTRRPKAAQPFVVPVHPEQKGDPEWKQALREILDRHHSDEGVPVRMTDTQSKKVFATPFKVRVSEELKAEIKKLYSSGP